MSLYSSVEKALFNTLTKKIVGNVLFLLLPHVVLLVIGFYHFEKLEAYLNEVNAGALPVDVLKDHLSTFWTYGFITVSFALVTGIGTIFFMRHLFLRPINEITNVLKAIKENDGDISATLPEYTHDEISEMAESYNGFSTSLKSMIAESRRRSVNVALCSTRLQKFSAKLRVLRISRKSKHRKYSNPARKLLRQLIILLRAPCKSLREILKTWTRYVHPVTNWAEYSNRLEPFVNK